VAAPAVAAAADEESSYEVLRYRWRLKGVRGAVAGLFLPSQGEGSLTTAAAPNGGLTSELLITAKAGAGGDYWRYGSELDPAGRRTLRAWSSYVYRGERKSKETRLDGGADIVDVASGIYLIRQDPPNRPRRMRIWSDGKLYPVVVVPRGVETRRTPKGPLRVRHFTIRGVKEPGERQWKGSMDLWLADDEAATPVEIQVERSWAGVRLELDGGA
jgi:uncharacterized protein DUF3108